MTFVLSLIIFHFDVNSVAREIGVPLPALTPWETFRILRQTSPLGRELMQFRATSDMGPRPQALAERLIVPRDDEYDQAMDRLVEACERECAPTNPDAAVCLEAARHLRAWNSDVSSQPRSWPHVMHFPATASAAYDAMLRRNEPSALAIFVYWCVLINRAPARYYLNSSIKRAAYFAMATLDVGWQPLMAWPRKELLTEPGVLFGWMVS